MGPGADEYFRQTSTATSEKQPVDFAAFSRRIEAVGGQKLVTVDGGSDTPQGAAAWVEESEKSGQGVALGELGNELYGSWENDTHPDPHTASSYAANGLPYLKAMKAADPSARICYDYAMDGSLAPGSGVEDRQNRNTTVLKAAARYYDCGYDPTAFFVVGETNMSQTHDEWNQQVVGGLFAAANTLGRPSYGAQSVRWWDVHDYGTRTAGFGMFSSAGEGRPATSTPFPTGPTL